MAFVFNYSIEHQPGTIPNELYQETNLALLCEDIVNGMIAANEFRGAGSGDVAIPAMNENSRKIPESLDPHSPIEIILDIESREWEYKIQPGMPFNIDAIT